MNLVTIANCHSLDEAIGLRMLLEGAGIPAFIPDESTSSVAPHHFLTAAGVRLQVLEENAEEAKQLISEARGS
ncbi:MAG: putative signal transducing protein [Limisphaerales bacterium]